MGLGFCTGTMLYHTTQIGLHVRRREIQILGPFVKEDHKIKSIEDTMTIMQLEKNHEKINVLEEIEGGLFSKHTE